MDDIVKAALKKWPNVPACHGWLALDARGDWYMRDDRIQAAGPFPEVKGSRITHDKLKDFIHRNYAADEQGAWFFQNGPQRVYVELEAAPYVWRLQADPSGPVVIWAHTGTPAHFESAVLDEHGRLFLHTDLGFGVVHSLDMEAAAQAVETGLWPLQELRFAELPGRFGYRLSPQRDLAPG
ncbi:DUF2946 family protein [Caldimonas brevitalea]|uniref:DUF2946 family protein n=1 Tax=Caldimonas brevitalea TaxID=413882 RepID=A0A0G3BXG2_9BURK|nr:DUF2946 family protein [Caldimonas brevitalea]AKJ32061.1 hypothetical protein AAW51_5370 [Caldimonas brevitalea]